jgi:thiol-disulfide isomerase/thioredoxin
MRITMTRRSCVLLAGLIPFLTSAQLPDVDGRPAALFTPSGAANVLIFVSSDCPISNGYAPEIQRLCGAYHSKGVRCSLVYEDESIDSAAVRKHLEEYRYAGIPAVIDADRTVARRAGASVTPQAVVLDATGKVRYRGRIDNFYAALGQPRQRATVHDLRDALDAVIAGRTVATPETEALGCFITSAKDTP